MALVELLYNLAMLVALSVVSGFVDTRWKRETRLGMALQGLVFGGAALIGMIRPLVLAPGLIFDGRSVVISLGALFFGPWTAAITCLMTIPLRIHQGGPGMHMGISVILSSAAIGLIYHMRTSGKPWEISTARLYRFGLLVHVAMLCMTVALPPHLRLTVLQRTGWPVMLAYPLATVLIGKILSDHAARNFLLQSLRESEQRFRAIFNCTFQFIGLMTPTGILIEANRTALEFGGISREEAVNRPFCEMRWWSGNEARVQQLKEAIAVAARGEFVRYEVELQGRGGTTTIIDFSLTPVFDAAGKVVLLIPEGRDIAERKRGEEALRAAHQQLATIIEFFPDATIVLDEHGKVIAWNRACEVLTGVEKEAMLGRGEYAHAEPFYGARRPMLIDMLDTPDDEVAGKYDYVRRDGEMLTAEAFSPFLRGGKGAYIWGTAAPLYDWQGRRCGAIEVIRDVSEQKQIERALRESEQTLRSVFATAPVGICIMKDRRYVSANRFYCEKFGYTEEGIIGKTPRVLYESEEEWNRVGQELYANLHETGFASVETRMRCADGSYLDTVISAAPIRQDDPLADVVVIVHDITERKRAEVALLERTEQLRLALGATRMGIWRFDLTTGRITTVLGGGPISGMPEEVYPSTEDEFLKVVHPADRESVAEELRQFLGAGELLEDEFRIVLPDGEIRWVQAYGHCSRDASGKPLRVLGVDLDITGRKQAEEQVRQLNEELRGYATELEQRVAERTEELAVAKDRAEEADHLKSAFLATMSHELRTPLNSIIGFTGILLQELAGPLNPEQHKQLEMVRGSSKHLLALINDVLDISKIEAGQMTISRGSFDLRKSIEKVVSIVKPLAEKKGLAMTTELAPQIGNLHSDARRVEQILLNLLNNAVKFTDHGSVTLQATPLAPTPNAPPSAVRISITDTGIGIKPEDLEKLFQPFRQIDSGLARQHEGTGLGLAICRRLAELLDGEIDVTSEQGKGSVFAFTLPLTGPGEP